MEIPAPNIGYRSAQLAYPSSMIALPALNRGQELSSWSHPLPWIAASEQLNFRAIFKIYSICIWKVH